MASIERANTVFGTQPPYIDGWRSAEREARTRAIFDTAVDGIITIDEQGKIESLNRAERLFGYVAAEALDRTSGCSCPRSTGKSMPTILRAICAPGRRRSLALDAR